MSFVYILFKLYPFFGISIAFLCWDLAQSYRRKANNIWILFLILMIIMLATTLAWFVLRGDQNADQWNNDLQLWLFPDSKPVSPPR